MADRGFLVAPGLADRMISTIRRVEGAPYKYGNASIPVRFEDDGDGGGRGGTSVRACTFVGEWLKGTTKTITFISGENITDPIESSPGNETATAWNILLDVAGACDGLSRKAIVAQIDDVWVLVTPEC